MNNNLLNTANFEPYDPNVVYVMRKNIVIPVFDSPLFMSELKCLHIPRLDCGVLPC